MTTASATAAARWGLIALAVLSAGCGQPRTVKVRGDAETVLVTFYEALIREDWPAAHALLHAESRELCPPDQFTHLARAYRRRLGFEPHKLRVPSCEEQGDSALAHVVLVGSREGRERLHRDTIGLRRSGESWGVVLPARFGRPH
jgi:hypothetical protein